MKCIKIHLTSSQYNSQFFLLRKMKTKQLERKVNYRSL